MANFIITIGRQFGSGGRHIGELVAKELGVPFLDEELITLAAENSELCKEAIAEADEKNANSLLYTLAMGSSAMLHSSHYNMPINDKVFLVQSDIIRSAAEKGSAVIVGRCADYVLREHPGLISVFIYAEDDFRINNVATRGNISKSEAQSLINKTDRRRANYYNFYSGKRWGELTNYDISLDASKLGAEKTAKIIAEYAKLK